MTSNPPPPARKVNHAALAAGLGAGLGFGLLATATGSPLLTAVATGVRPLGTLFINAIQMVVIPLVVSVIFIGIARLGDLRKAGRLGGSSILFFWLTTLPAILIGMGLMALTLRFSPEVAPPVVQESTAAEFPGMVDFLVNLVPRNPFQAAASGTLLPLIVFAAIFGAATGALPNDHRNRLLSLADSVTEALVTIVYWILWVGPVGLFGLTAPITAELGWSLLASLGIFILTVIVGLFAFIGLVYVPAARFLGRVPLGMYMRGTLGACTVGFSATSSVAALPVMLADAETRLGVSPTTARLVLPLAASLNRAGSALFQGASVVFLASLYDVPLPPAAVTGALLATFLAAMTVAPVPSASIVSLVPTLATVGVPQAGLAVLLGIDRIPDMFRSATNVLGHMTASAVVDEVVGGQTGNSAPSKP